MAYRFIIFLFLFLSCIFIFSFSHSPPHLHFPILFLLPSSLLLYSLPIHESWATTDFLSTISQIPSSLIYKISFPGVFFFLFTFCSLSPLCSILESPIGVGLVVGLWFPIVIDMGVGLWVVGLWLRIVIGMGLWVMVGLCVCVFCLVFCSSAWWVCLSVFLLFSHWFEFCDCLLFSRRSGFCDCNGDCFVIWKRKVVVGFFIYLFIFRVVDFGCHSGGWCW